MSVLHCNKFLYLAFGQFAYQEQMTNEIINRKKLRQIRDIIRSSIRSSDICIPEELLVKQCYHLYTHKINPFSRFISTFVVVHVQIYFIASQIMGKP